MKSLPLCTACVVVGLLGCTRSTTSTETDQPAVVSAAERELKSGRRALERGDLPQAIRHLDASIAVEPSVEAYYRRGQAYLESELPGLALEDAEQGMKLAPEDWNLKSLFARAQGELDAIREQRVEPSNAPLQLGEAPADIVAAHLRSQGEPVPTASAVDMALARLDQQRPDRQQQAERLQRWLTKSRYWSAKTPAERKAYLEAAVAANSIRAEIAAREAVETNYDHAVAQDPSLEQTPKQIEQRIQDFLRSIRDRK